MWGYRGAEGFEAPVESLSNRLSERWPSQKRRFIDRPCVVLAGGTGTHSPFPSHIPLSQNLYAVRLSKLG